MAFATRAPLRPSQQGVTVWFTGLPSAGKTTIATLVGERLAERGRPVELLDGDVVRAHMSRGLGFSKADRGENIRRIGYVAGLLTGHSVTVLVSAVSPYRAVRDEVRARISRVGRFAEAYVAADPVQRSGTAVRDLLGSDQLPPPQFSRPEVARLLADGYRARRAVA